MFIQIIQGKCSRQDELRALAESWRSEVADASSGFLGGTYGFTDDDMFVGVIRFEDRDKAMANSARPEQTAWSERMMALMDGPVQFHDCDDVTMMLDGGSDKAGFVQVIQGKVDDAARLKELMTDTEVLHRERPEIIGGTLAIEPDGTFTETIAFTSETDARKGEQKEMPEEVRETLEGAMHDVVYLDLHRPWFESAL
ncbi:MAG: hypothetical protein ACXVWU_11965 [Nocardioides sp.]